MASHSSAKRSGDSSPALAARRCGRRARSGSSRSGGTPPPPRRRASRPAGRAARRRPGARSSRRSSTIVSPKIEAVSASVSGVVNWKMPCGARQRGVHAVAELVGHHEHVVRARGVVEHHVRVRATAPCTSRTRRRACPAAAARRCSRPAKNSRGHLAQLRREAPSSSRARSLAPRRRGCARPTSRHRRHAVPVGEPVEPEQPRLEASTSAAPARSGPAPPRSAPRPTRRSPRWRGCARRASAGRRAAGPSSPCPASSVLNTNARVRRPGRSASVTAAAASRARSRSGSWRRLSASSSEAGSSRPGSGTSIAEVCSVKSRRKAERAGHVRLREHALLRLGELVGAVAAQGAQVVAAEAEPVVGEQLVGPLVRQPRSTRARRRGAASRSPRRARCARWSSAPRCRVGRVEREAEHRVGAGAARRGRRSRPARASPRPAPPASELGHATAVGARRTPRRGRAPRRAAPPRPRRPSAPTSGSRSQAAASSGASTVALTPVEITRQYPSNGRLAHTTRGGAAGRCRGGRPLLLKREDVHELGAFKWRGALPALEKLPRRRRGRRGHRVDRQPRRGDRLGRAAHGHAGGRVRARGGERGEAGAAGAARRRAAPGRRRPRRGEGRGPRARRARTSCRSSRTAPSRPSSTATRRSARRSSSSWASRPRAVIVPVGNGALLDRRARAASARGELGVVAKEAPVMALSVEAGHPVECDRCATFADGLAVRVAIPLAVEELRRLGMPMQQVSERAIAHGVRRLRVGRHPRGGLGRRPRWRRSGSRAAEQEPVVADRHRPQHRRRPVSPLRRGPGELSRTRTCSRRSRGRTCGRAGPPRPSGSAGPGATEALSRNSS